jgi:hypothetical protein
VRTAAPLAERKRGTEAAATLDSLIDTAKLHEVHAARSLREAARAADRGEALLPWDLVDAAG